MAPAEVGTDERRRRQRRRRLEAARGRSSAERRAAPSETAGETEVPQDTVDDVATAPDDRLAMAPDDVGLDTDVSEPEQAGGYVPMSEWIEDFDRRP